MNKTIIGAIVVVVIVAAGAGLFFLRGQNTSAPATTTETQTDTSTNDTSTTQQVPVDADSEVDEMVVEGDEHGDETMEENVDEAREIVVEGTSFKFTPSSLSVSPGEKVKIVFKNTGGTHDFRIEELGIGTKVINGGSQESFEFTVPEDVESLTYFCSVANHRQLGMEGVITVE